MDGSLQLDVQAPPDQDEPGASFTLRLPVAQIDQDGS